MNIYCLIWVCQYYPYPQKTQDVDPSLLPTSKTIVEGFQEVWVHTTSAWRVGSRSIINCTQVNIYCLIWVCQYYPYPQKTQDVYPSLLSTSKTIVEGFHEVWVHTTSAWIVGSLNIINCTQVNIYCLIWVCQYYLPTSKGYQHLQERNLEPW